MKESEKNVNSFDNQHTILQMIKHKTLHDPYYVVFLIACILSLAYLIHFVYFKIEVAILIQIIGSLSYIVILHDYSFQEKPNGKEYLLVLLWMILVNLLNHFLFLGFHLLFHFYVGVIAIFVLIFVRDRIFLKTIIFLGSFVLFLTGILSDQSEIVLNPLSTDLLQLYHQISDYSFYLLFFIVMLTLIILSTSLRKTILISMEERQALIAERNFLFGATGHELRSFLHSSNGLIEDLLSVNLNHANEGTLKQILSMNRRMLSMANQMLDTTKTIDQIDTEKYQLYDLRSIISSLEGQFAPQFQKKRLVFSISYPSHYESIFLGNESTIYHIIDNLLQNALKYTKFGKVNLSLDVQKTEERKAKIQISVQDTGIGIEKDELTHIFEPWIQLKKKQVKVGFGLGLYIVHILTKSIGGSIHVNSEVGKGSTFTLELEQEIAQLSSKPKNIIEQPELPQLRALIVDDNKMNSRVLEVFLSRLRIEVKSVHDHFEFFTEMIESKDSYDILFLDYDLGETNGIDMINQIQDHISSERKLPFIFLLTGLSKHDIALKEPIDKIDKVLYKPINFDTIQEEVYQLVKNQNISIK